MVFNANLFAPSGGEQAEYTKVKSFFLSGKNSDDATSVLLANFSPVSMSGSDYLSIEELSITQPLDIEPGTLDTFELVTIGSTSLSPLFWGGGKKFTVYRLENASGSSTNITSPTTEPPYNALYSPHTIKLTANNVSFISKNNGTTTTQISNNYFNRNFSDIYININGDGSNLSTGNLSVTVGKIKLSIGENLIIFQPVRHNTDNTFGYLNTSTNEYIPFELAYPNYPIYANFAV